MVKKIKNILRNVKVIAYFLNKYRNRKRSIYLNNIKIFENKNGLEIGGPTDIFKEERPIPLYHIIKELDNVIFEKQTFWGDFEQGKNYIFNNKKQMGRQYIADGTDLSFINDNTYDFLLASHVIEHLANPIKALNEWKRIIKPDGYLLLIAPNHENTYDWKRPLTSLDHIISDYKNNTTEDDETHFKEVIALHDLTIDDTVKSLDEHIKRTINNKSTRIVHHHTFNKSLLIGLLNYCNLNIIDFQFIKPWNLVVIVRNETKHYYN